MKKLLCTLCAGVAFSCLGLSVAEAWSLEEAAKDYKGTEIKVIFLDRPGYRATIKMLPEFAQKNGHQGFLRNRPLREHSRKRGA